MAKSSTPTEAGQEGSLREGLEAAIRERVREVIELILGEEVEAALGASRSQRVELFDSQVHCPNPLRRRVASEKESSSEPCGVRCACGESGNGAQPPPGPRQAHLSLTVVGSSCSGNSTSSDFCNVCNPAMGLHGRPEKRQNLFVREFPTAERAPASQNYSTSWRFRAMRTLFTSTTL